MNTETLSLLFFGSLVLSLVIGIPLAFALGGVSTIFLFLTWGPDAFLLIYAKIWTSMGSFILVALPLFIFMAMVLERIGIAKNLYHMMALWWGGIRGGLAVGTVCICAIFAAMCGISGAAVATMGTIALPSMLDHGYDRKIALGCINIGGGLGIMIPPSTLMILYSLITGVSVGKMFAAGVLPGLVLIVLSSAYILIRCFFQPDLGPARPPEDRASWSEKFRSLKGVILPALIIVAVLGSIVMGVATPTEAAAFGAVGAIFSAALSRELNLKLLREASVRTFLLTGMIMWILFGAHVLSAVYQSIGAREMIESYMAAIPGGEWVSIIVMQIILLFLGMILDPVGIMMLTLPVFIPLVEQMGFSPIWFGILFTINMELAYMTPPFGFNLFYLRGVVPEEIAMRDIYASAIPFVFVGLVGMAIIMIFPQIAIFLPGILFGY